MVWTLFITLTVKYYFSVMAKEYRTNILRITFIVIQYGLVCPYYSVNILYLTLCVNFFLKIPSFLEGLKQLFIIYFFLSHYF